MSNSKKINVLIVKLASIGDVLASSSLPRAIKESNPNVNLLHLVMRNCSFVTDNNPFIDEQCIIEFIPSGSKFIDLIRIFKVLLILRRKNIDIAFIMHRNIIFQVICKFAGIKKIYGYTSRFNPFYTKHIKYSFDVNRTLQDCELIRVGGVDIECPQTLDYFPKILELQPSLNQLVPEVFVACNPGGGNAHSPADNRMWPIEHYAELINRSALPFVVLGYGPSDEKRATRLSELVKSGRMINLVGKTTFSETALILGRASVYVGNDSSLMFLAAAMRTKTLGLYGPTQAVAANPIGKQQYAIRSDAPCAPCYNPYQGIKGSMYTCKNNLCMQIISVDTVLNKMNELIDIKAVLE